MKKGYLILPVFIFILFGSVFGQRVYHIKKSTSEVKIDGELQEEQWAEAEVADQFTVKYPNAGEPSKFESNVFMFYDDDAIYFGGILRDHQPDSVSYTLSQRDDEGNADWFGVTIDPYANNVNAFSFLVTSAGVEWDAIEFQDDIDISWNSVWKSATKRRDDGWSFEMRIPFSAIRFPNKTVQEWNINLIRNVRRTREQSFWNPVDPNVFGEITQAGKLVGIEKVKSPLRLSLTPYVTGYLENYTNSLTGKKEWRQRVNGGLDVKYGLNDAFTLDMTLIPDFGQTVSDRQVLNLGPFEVQFAENRPFFLEGTELFSIGNVFYSRRIGAEPRHFNDAYSALDESKGEEVISNPSLAPLLNAAKVSGRTTKGLGVGVFNAIEGEAAAEIRDSLGNVRSVKTHSLTNYNVFVLSQTLKNNSTVSFVNTNVARQGTDPDANVSVGQAKLFSRDRKYNLTSTVKISSIFKEGKADVGHSTYHNFEKVSGSFRYNIEYGEESDNYDPNDLGFLYNNNSRYYASYVSWNDFTPGKHFLRKWGGINAFYEELYKPRLFSYANIGWDGAGTLKNFLTLGVNGNFNPFGEVDHFESRKFGKEVRFGENFRVGGFISSDYSKRFALDLRTSYKQFFNSAQKAVSVTVSPRVRLSDRVFAVWRSTVDFIVHDFGYVRILDDNYSNALILGVRNREIVENVLNMEYIFTKRMGINLQLRHYWQQVDYSYFLSLRDKGVLQSSDYYPLQSDGTSAHNTSFNAFTLDVNYRWVFFPGSELRVVYKNNIFASQSELLPSYFDTFDTLFDRPQINSISAKLLVFIDAMYFRRKEKKSAAFQ